MLVVAAGLLCAACESDRTMPVTSGNANPFWWTDDLRALQRQYLGAVAEECRPAGVGSEKCMKERIAGSLSPDGEVAKHCPMDDPLSIYVDCVDLLTTAAQARAAFGLDPPSDMDWTDPYKAMADAAQLVADALIEHCRRSSERTCIAREITYRFAADSAEADRCAALSDQELQIRCALGLSLMEKYRSAMLYVG